MKKQKPPTTLGACCDIKADIASRLEIKEILDNYNEEKARKDYEENGKDGQDG